MKQSYFTTCSHHIQMLTCTGSECHPLSHECLWIQKLLFTYKQTYSYDTYICMYEYIYNNMLLICCCCFLIVVVLLALYLTVVKSTCERRKSSLTIQVWFGQVIIVVVVLVVVVNSSEFNFMLSSICLYIVQCEADRKEIKWIYILLLDFENSRFPLNFWWNKILFQFIQIVINAKNK